MKTAVFHMRLNEKDLFRINILKQVYGYNKTPQLIRHLITRDIEKMLEDGRLRKRSSQSQSTTVNNNEHNNIGSNPQFD